MDVMHVGQAVDNPKRVMFDNSNGATDVTINKGEALKYDTTTGTLNVVKRLEATNTNNVIFAGVAREQVTIPAGLKGYFEIDEPGSITEALVLDASTDGVAVGATLIWEYSATKGGVFKEIASKSGRGAAILLEAVTAANPAVATLRKVFLDEGSFQVSYSA